MKFVVSLVLLAFSSTAYASIPAFPMSFWGSVTIDGQSAPVGSFVRVYDENSAQIGEVVLSESGIYGYTEPTKKKLIVGEGQGTLTFTIQSPSINGGIETKGLQTITYSGFTSGETINKDLAFLVTPTTVVTPPSSGGGGGGGGGGGSSRTKKIETPAATVLGASTTASTTEDETIIALQKQLIELLIQLITLLKMRL